MLTMGICDKDEDPFPLNPLGCVGGDGQALHNLSKSEDFGWAREDAADNAEIRFKALRRKSCPGLSG